jgi:hypothetical protein
VWGLRVGVCTNNISLFACSWCGRRLGGFVDPFSKKKGPAVPNITKCLNQLNPRYSKCFTRCTLLPGCSHNNTCSTISPSYLKLLSHVLKTPLPSGLTAGRTTKRDCVCVCVSYDTHTHILSLSLSLSLSHTHTHTQTQNTAHWQSHTENLGKTLRTGQTRGWYEDSTYLL